jgi:hypothetical protein
MASHDGYCIFVVYLKGQVARSCLIRHEFSRFETSSNGEVRVSRECLMKLLPEGVWFERTPILLRKMRIPLLGNHCSNRSYGYLSSILSAVTCQSWKTPILASVEA